MGELELISHLFKCKALILCLSVKGPPCLDVSSSGLSADILSGISPGCLLDRELQEAGDGSPRLQLVP